MKALWQFLRSVALIPWLPVFASAFVVPTAGGNELQLLSLRSPSAPSPTVANGDSIAPRLSGNGRFVLFSSTASDLVTNDNSHQGLDVFLHDRATSETVLASVNWSGTGGGNGHSVGLQVSSYGRYVLLQSDASDLMPGDTNEATDIFVRDVLLGTSTLVSAAADGGWGPGDCTGAAMTPDGRWVAFVSEATNVVSGDTNGIPDLFLRDLVLGMTTWVTAGATGWNAAVSSPVITPDGRFLAFFSSAKGMADGVPSASRGEIYLYDSVLDTMTWASTNAATTAQSILNLPNMPSYHPSLSDDGRYVVFKTGWTNGTSTPIGGATAAAIPFLFNAFSGSTSILGTNCVAPWFGSDDVYGPEMSPDGRFTVFVEYQTAIPTNSSVIRLWDRVLDTTIVVSLDRNGLLPTNTASHTPVVSDDGRYVTFVSDATNLVTTSISNGFHIYRRDLLASTNVLVDLDTSGIGSGDQFGVTPSMSSDGSTVAYSTWDGALVGADGNKAPDVFIWNETVGTNTLVSARHPSALSTSGNRLSSLGAISLSGDGGRAVFASFASDLVTNDFNCDCDVFLHDQIAGTNLLVSVGLDGNAGSGGGSHSPVISEDGNSVVFVSTATNLVAGDINEVSDVFLRDLIAGTTTMINVNSNGVNLGYHHRLSPVISRDARYVAFLASPHGGYWDLYWRDLDSGATHLVRSDAVNYHPLSMSADGQRVSYVGGWSTDLLVWDAASQTDIYTNTLSTTTAVLAPAGNRVLYQNSTELYVRDLPGVTNELLYPTSVQIKGPSQWSGDGRYVVFVADTDLLSGDTNGTNDVYLRDLQTGTLTLISVNEAGTASADGASDWPVFSADGRFVAFRTFATDVAPGIVSPPSLVAFDRVTGLNALLVTRTTANDATVALARPTLDTNGTTVGFQSWDAGLVAGDLNRAGDAFAGTVDILSPLDTDGDGIPDWWTTQYFGHPTGQEADLSRAQDDADGDGLTNLEEFTVGTSPVDPGSAFAITITRGTTPGTATLHWPALPGRSYQVFSLAGPADSSWEVVPGGLTILGGKGHFDVQAGGSTSFFQVVCGD